jgi:putative phosphoesterase
MRRADMTTRIGLISDVHATVAPVEEALSVFERERVDMILCAGDIAGYGSELDQTVAVLVESACQAVRGNHEVWFLEDNSDRPEHSTFRFLNGLPFVLESTIEGKTLYMVHASPPQSYMDGIKLLDQQGEILADRKRYWTQCLSGFDRDVLVVGHTHQVFAVSLGRVLVVNPGSTKFNHSCAILTLPDMRFEVYPLSGRTPVKSWNWGMTYKQNQTGAGS